MSQVRLFEIAGGIIRYAEIGSRGDRDRLIALAMSGSLTADFVEVWDGNVCILRRHIKPVRQPRSCASSVTSSNSSDTEKHTIENAIFVAANQINKKEATADTRRR